MTMKRWEEDLQIKKKEGYRFKIDKGRLYSSLLVVATFGYCLILKNKAVTCFWLLPAAPTKSPVTSTKSFSVIKALLTSFS